MRLTEPGHGVSRPRWQAATAVFLVCVSAVVASQAAQPDPIPQGLAGFQALEATIKRTVAEVAPSVVGVRVGTSQGSGVIVSADGHVATAAHVIGKPHQQAVFLLPDGRRLQGVTLGLDRNRDCGLMKITEPGPWPHVPWGSLGEISEGDWCLALGHPLGFQANRPPVVRLGRLLALDEGLLRTDCQIIAGDSGGPLFDLRGRCIGVHTKIGGLTTQNYHVPAEAYRQRWERLVAGETIEPGLPRRDDSLVKQGLQSIVAPAAASVVRIRCDGRAVALGTVVGTDGWIATKASELTAARPLCQFADGQECEASIHGIDPAYDLALLRTSRQDLPLPEWSERAVEIGQWVIVPGVEPQARAVGVVGATTREIPAPRGMLGVGLRATDEGTVFASILADSPAEKAGLKVGDVIVAVDGQAMDSPQAVGDALRGRRPDDMLSLTLRRAGREIVVDARMGLLDTPAIQRRDVQNSTGAGISRRHDDFPAVFQHDSTLAASDCGGPLLDLNGKAIGLNIARGGRTEAYAIPIDILQERLAALRAAPASAGAVVQAAHVESAAATVSADDSAGIKLWVESD